MAYTYKRIDELTPIESLNINDMFLIARSSRTGTDYATYYTTLANLSNQVEIDVQALKIITKDID